MTTWSKDELRRTADSDDLHISPLREDGVTYGTPTWIWSVAVGDGLYVRPYYGQNSRWYQAAVRQKAGRIIAAGLTKEVTFEPVDGPINDLIDDAYRAKYRGRPYLSSMVSARARSATVKGHAAGDQYRYSKERNTTMIRILLAFALGMAFSHAVCGVYNTTTKQNRKYEDKTETRRQGNYGHFDR